MSTTLLLAAGALLARPTGGEGVKAGPIGLAVILVLCIVAYFLFKSMSKHLKRVRTEFPSDAPADPPEPAEHAEYAEHADQTESTTERTDQP